MADSDVQILATGADPVPLDYVVKDTVVLQPKMIQALFTDNGAGADWLPAVVFISDSGHVLGRAVDQAVKVTAGDNAEVSWFPGVKHGGATPTASLAQSFVDQATGAFTVPSGALTSITFSTFTQAQGFNPGTFATGGLPSSTLTFVSFQTVVSMLTVDWPAGAYDRYIQLTVANPPIAQYTKDPRLRGSLTPDSDRQTLTAIVEGGTTGPTTVTAQAFQASGVNQAISASWITRGVTGHIFVT